MKSTMYITPLVIRAYMIKRCFSKQITHVQYLFRSDLLRLIHEKHMGKLCILPPRNCVCIFNRPGFNIFMLQKKVMHAYMIYIFIYFHILLLISLVIFVVLQVRTKARHIVKKIHPNIWISRNIIRYKR